MKDSAFLALTLQSFVACVAVAFLSACSTTSSKHVGPPYVRKVDYSAAPQMQALAERAQQTGNQMYPSVCALLTDGNSDFPPQFDICFKKKIPRMRTGEAGTWRVELSPPADTPAPPNFPSPPWHGFKTCNRGGTMSEGNELPGNWTAHGVRQKIGPRLFALTCEAFWDDAVLGSGKTKVRETIRLSRELNSYETVESFGEDYDRDGNLLYPAYVIESGGFRMQVEPASQSR